MGKIPHPDEEGIVINCGVITVSDTRTKETDRSGKLIQELLHQANCKVVTYTIVKDDPIQIKEQLKLLDSNREIDCLIFNGGTGIAPRDTTYDALASMLEKTLPGFGELFRMMSYQEVGSRAMASRAIAGIYKNKLIFSLPGSTNAVKLACQELILPELEHLVKQLRS